MWLIVGLGNPEKKYETTRHNVGFLAIDALCKSLNATWKIKKDSFAHIAETMHEDEKLILVKPQTYMNLSGKAVASLMHRFHIEPTHLIVLFDDVDLPVGTIRTRNEGSSGGHNGIKSIATSIGTQQFKRIKIGVGKNPPHIPLEHWVLSIFPKKEAEIMQGMQEKAASVALDIVHGRIQSQTTIAPSLPQNP